MGAGQIRFLSGRGRVCVASHCFALSEVRLFGRPGSLGVAQSCGMPPPLGAFAMDCSFRCVFRANGAIFSNAIHCYRMKYKAPFKPEKGLKFQYFPVVSRREGILECPLLWRARSSSGVLSICGVIMPQCLPFVKNIIGKRECRKRGCVDMGDMEMRRQSQPVS